MVKRRRPPAPPAPPSERADCRHCRNARRLEQAAVAVPEARDAALRRAAFERSLCEHS